MPWFYRQKSIQHKASYGWSQQFKINPEGSLKIHSFMFEVLIVVLDCLQVCILLCWGCWQPTTPTSASWRTGCVRRRWLVPCLCWGRWCCPSVLANTHRTSSTRVRRAVGKETCARLSGWKLTEYRNKLEIIRKWSMYSTLYLYTSIWL